MRETSVWEEKHLWRLRDPLTSLWESRPQEQLVKPAGLTAAWRPAARLDFSCPLWFCTELWDWRWEKQSQRWGSTSAQGPHTLSADAQWCLHSIPQQSERNP